ncbi:maturation control protein [Pantoea agglomerans]|uniref:maturation control protein n=1 Tax=Enterobacter agglomerans TaxID=549 RepID=UPI003C7A0A3E
MKQKIAVISLSTSQPMAITAIFEENALVMSKANNLPKGLKGQLEKLTPYVEKLRSQGFKVLVDETSGTIANATGASHVSLKTRGNDGRAAVIVGIERYKELVRQQNIALPQNNKGSFEIPDSIVDVDYNASGEEIYRINWPDIRPEHVLTILCCFAIGYQNVASADYINALAAAAGEKRPSLVDSFKRIIGFEKSKSVEDVPQTLTGQRISDEERIL